MTLINEIAKAAKATPREFFAPIIGAFKGIQREYKDIERAEPLSIYRRKAKPKRAKQPLKGKGLFKKLGKR